MSGIITVQTPQGKRQIALPIPPEQWGRDHWSALLYIETVCVDGQGIPGRQKVQCNANRHPGLLHHSPITNQPQDGSTYTIRLKSAGHEIPGPDYDEWDCLEDAEAAGFIESLGTGINPRFRMTGLGNRAAHQFRAHKSQGGNLTNFDYFPPDNNMPAEEA